MLLHDTVPYAGYPSRSAAGTGVVMLLFLVGHVTGNLKVFLPDPEPGVADIDAYAEFLRTVGEPAPGSREDRQHLQSADQAVAGRCLVENQQVTGSLAAELTAGFLQLLQHVAVADLGPQEIDAEVAEGPFEAVVPTRDRGAGRPTKKDRRKMQQFRRTGDDR